MEEEVDEETEQESGEDRENEGRLEQDDRPERRYTFHDVGQGQADASLGVPALGDRCGPFARDDEG